MMRQRKNAKILVIFILKFVPSLQIRGESLSNNFKDWQRARKDDENDRKNKKTSKIWSAEGDACEQCRCQYCLQRYIACSRETSNFATNVSILNPLCARLRHVSYLFNMEICL